MITQHVALLRVVARNAKRKQPCRPWPQDGKESKALQLVGVLLQVGSLEEDMRYMEKERLNSWGEGKKDGRQDLTQAQPPQPLFDAA